MKEGFTGPSYQPCCGVTAVATCAEVPFPIVFEHMKHVGGRTEGWKGRTIDTARENALKHFGVQYEKRDFQKEKVFVQFWQWAFQYAKPGVTYMVNIPGHVVTFKDFHIIDQYWKTPTHIAYAKMGRSYIGNSMIENTLEITHVPSKEERNRQQQRQQKQLEDIF